DTLPTRTLLHDWLGLNPWNDTTTITCHHHLPCTNAATDCVLKS
ncbi:unnamed protein product, partial [Allacma fusca]